jgi:exocyst complex component 4
MRQVRIFVAGDGSEEVLRDLLWTLYSKLSAVLSGHRVVHDCVLGIVKEHRDSENLRDTPEYNYLEVWKPIQSEVPAPPPAPFPSSASP